MRLIKVLNLLIAAALMLAAFIGTASAPAAKLCRVPGETGKKCPAFESYPAREFKTKLESGTKLEIKAKAPGPVLECNESTMVGKTTAASGTPIPGELKTMTLLGEKCTNYCESTTMNNLSYKLGIYSIAADGFKDGEFLLTKSGTENPPVIKMTKCGASNITCEFTGAVGVFGGQLFFKLVGGNPAKLVSGGELFLYSAGSGEGVCGEEAKFFATYTFSEPTSVYVTEN